MRQPSLARSATAIVSGVVFASGVVAEREGFERSDSEVFVLIFFATTVAHGAILASHRLQPFCLRAGHRIDSAASFTNGFLG